MPGANKDTHFEQIKATLRGITDARTNGYYRVGNLIYRPPGQPGRPTMLQVGENSYYINENGITLLDEDLMPTDQEVEDYQDLLNQITAETQDHAVQFAHDIGINQMIQQDAELAANLQQGDAAEAPGVIPQPLNAAQLTRLVIAQIEQENLEHAQRVFGFAPRGNQFNHNPGQGNQDVPSPSPRVTQVTEIQLDSNGRPVAAKLLIDREHGLDLRGGRQHDDY